jgi:nitrous oxide reductase accessory protein NosL
MVSILLASCARRAERCAYCGMPLDPKSAWNAQLVLNDGTKAQFDSPRCAFLAWRTGQVEAKDILVRDYYDQTSRSGREVVFVASSDVIGPMGADLVPVDTARASQFAREHIGTRPLPLDQITLPLLKELH